MGDFQDSWWATSVFAALLTALHFIVMGFAAGHVVLTKRDNRAAIGWVGIILLTPFLGAALYFMFGVNRIQRRARRVARITTASPKFGVATTPVTATEIQQAIGAHAEQLAPLADFVHRVTHQPLVRGNRVTPLSDGDEAYRQMLAAIDGAKETVGLCTYIFDNDEIGRTFGDALGRATQRGVEVRVLIDDVGTRYSWPSIKPYLRQANVNFATFLPTLLPWKFHYSNLRNHRKLLVVDSRVGFTGGMNIRQGHCSKNPGAHPIADMHFRIEGPVLAQLQETLVLDWEFSTGERLDPAKWFLNNPVQGESFCRGIADGPDLDFDKIRLTLLGAIACARRSITIVTPYFLPDQAIITALNVADLRGVDVRVVLPERNNLRLVQWACNAQLWQVLRRGVRVWLTPPPFDHTKVMLVDETWSFIGSANWDARSLRLNFEFNVECYDRALAAQLRTLIDSKLQHSREITLADVDGRPLWMRLRDGVARLATPYL